MADAIPPASAMCECSHHWSVHAESGQTAPDAICHGYYGSATPGPLRVPCGCLGFIPWPGPRDARTGEPVLPLTLSTAPGPAQERQAAEAEFLAASIAVWREIDRLAAEPEGYHPVRMSVELRQAERAAWERYRDLLSEEGP